MDLERAIQIAVEAHAGQSDKAGEPYVLHPLRVMLALKSEEERIVAVLHDVVEDCDGWSFDRLEAEGFAPAILEALDSVTKREGEDYINFVRRSGENPMGRAVKMADLADNMDLARIAEPTARDRERIVRYRDARAYLSSLQ